MPRVCHTGRPGNRARSLIYRDEDTGSRPLDPELHVLRVKQSPSEGTLVTTESFCGSRVAVTDRGLSLEGATVRGRVSCLVGLVLVGTTSNGAGRPGWLPLRDPHGYRIPHGNWLPAGRSIGRGNRNPSELTFPQLR